MLVGNVGTLKAGVAAFPAASPTDGLLDVGVVTAAGPREWAGVLVQTLRKRPDTSPHATIGQGTRDRRAASTTSTASSSTAA